MVGRGPMRERYISYDGVKVTTGLVGAYGFVVGDYLNV